MTKEQLIIKFKRELSLRNYALSSINTYSGCLSVFLDNYKNYNGFQDIEDVKSFLLTINNTNYHKQFVATIHHFFSLVVGKQFTIFDIPYPRKTHYLPEILSVNEVYRLILSIQNLKQKAAIQLMYSCGLRIGEVANMQLAHIDGDRMLVLVKGAKGFKDRYVPIPEQTLLLLRNYYRQYKPIKYLFEGQTSQQYAVRSIQQVFKQGCKKAGIRKHVIPHCLRHSRLTHLKEAGIDIHELKEIAGHNNIKTTEIYLHLSKQSLVNQVKRADDIILSYIDKKLLVA